MGALHNISDSSGRRFQSAEPRKVILEAITDFEISILAALWNHKPKSLRIDHIYLYANPPQGAMLTPYAIALNSLIERGLVLEIVAPSFEYRLSRDGYWAIISLVAAGRGEKFEACLSGNALPAVQCKEGAGETASHTAPDYQWNVLNRPHILRKRPISKETCECGEAATHECPCGAPICDEHSYGSDGLRDPLGMCGKCYDESVSGQSMDVSVEMVRNITGRV